MPNKSWKTVERRAARLFHTVRTAGSGSMNRSIGSTSDTESSSFYIEVKHRATSWITSQFKRIASKAEKEKKLPVMVLKSKDCHRMLVIIDSEDLAAFVERYHLLSSG